MAKNGHWYTDKQGNHYFVEEGQSPKEGWEASKRRKMISGGKYKVSEDGNDYRDVDMDEYNKYEADEDEWDATRDEDIDGFDEEGDIEYNREMQKAQEENAAMSENEPQEESNDGWKVTSGSAVPGGRGGHTDYDDGKGNWITDWGDGKVYAYLDGKSLGKKFSSVDEAKAALNKKLGKEENKSEAIEHNPEESDDSEYKGYKILVDHGLDGKSVQYKVYEPNGQFLGSSSTMELAKKSIDSDKGENNNLPGAKPSSVGNRLKFKLPNQEEQVGTIESLDESGINAFGKKQKLYVVRTPDGRRIEVPGEYVVKPEYPGGMGDYVYDINNPIDYPDKKHNQTKNQKLNYSPEMKKVKNAIKGLTLDSKEERRKLLLQMLDEIDNEE